MAGRGGRASRRAARDPAAEPLDLAVVGGGVAGSYVAERLAGRRPDWRIALFERSRRVGGRLLSLRPPGVEGVRAELGGMRYRTSQPLVSRLVGELGLAARPFRTVHDDNRFLLRGRRWRAGDPGDAAAVYRLGRDERGRPPGALLLAAFERVVPGAGRLGDREWLAVKREHRFRGRLLRDWPLGDLLAAVLSEEGHRYVVDGFGYATVLAERNAADAIPWVLIETRPEAENQTLVDGMEALPRELVARFAAAGGTVLLGHDLVGLAPETVAGATAYRLRFDRRPAVLARRVVLALPRRALERLGGGVPLLDASGPRSLIASVTAHPAAKLFLAYERPWWRDAGTRGLRAVTDLPLSKVYYFDRPAGPAGDGPALLLASYSDGPSRDRWCALGDRPDPPADPGPYGSDRRWERYRASVRQVAAAQEQLRALHDADVPRPVASAFMDWGADPYGGAWHVWNPGVRSWEVMAGIVQPVPGHHVYLCGEAWSSSQGWVEGALESAERVVGRLA